MDLDITVEPRTVTGKANGRLRREGRVPGVVFGKGSDSVPVQIDAKELETLYRAAGKTSIVKLRIAGDGRGGRAAKSAMIKHLQRHPLTRRPLHVDFFLVDLTHEMQADIPLVVTGEAPGVELTGGTLLMNLDHLKVRALPADLPHQLEVDVTPLVDLDAAIHVRDIAVDTEKVHVLNDPDELVAKIAPARVEEEIAPTALETPEEATAAAGEETSETGPPERQEETAEGQ